MLLLSGEAAVAEGVAVLADEDVYERDEDPNEQRWEKRVPLVAGVVCFDGYERDDVRQEEGKGFWERRGVSRTLRVLFEVAYRS